MSTIYYYLFIATITVTFEIEDKNQTRRLGALKSTL